MNETVIRILLIIATLGVGALTAYFRTNTKLQSKVGKFIADAEEAWKSTTKSGGQKFEWVVDKLYDLVPAPLHAIFTRELIGAIVQRAFDAIQSYAKLQLDRALTQPEELEGNGDEK